MRHRPNRIQRGYQLVLLSFAVVAMLVPDYQLHVQMLSPPHAMTTAPV